MKPFAEWLAQTALSLTIQTHDWVIPTIQSIHIVAITVVMGSVFLIDLRVLGWAGRDQTFRETTARFGPWLSWGLGVLLATGVAMIVGEPARELLALSFWIKMALVATATLATVGLHRSLAALPNQGQPVVEGTSGLKALAVATFLVWLAVIVLGRLIAYDYVWGSWSEALKG